MEIALCKCGVDMTVHPRGHEFDAAGTRHRCGALVDGWMCPRPAYHEDEAVAHGPLTGEKLW